MSGGYKAPAPEGLGPIVRAFEGQARRLSEAETVTGTSLNSLVEQVQQAIAEIGTTINAWLLANSYTKAQIDSKVANPGTIAPADVNASGHGTFPTGVNSVDVYNRLLTYGGGYKNQYIHTDGNMGYVPSSRQFKQDIEEWVFDPSIVSYLRVVTFRYIAAVENLGDKAEQELGLIAEEVFELGYYWLVDYEVIYTEEGAKVAVPFQGEVVARPFGVKYERICLILLSWAQSIELRLEASDAWARSIEHRLDAAGV